MFESELFYKHDGGRDAVIHVIQKVEVADGYSIRCTWHTLNNAGRPCGPITDSYGQPAVYVHHITYNEAKYWRLYETFGL